MIKILLATFFLSFAGTAYACQTEDQVTGLVTEAYSDAQQSTVTKEQAEAIGKFLDESEFTSVLVFWRPEAQTVLVVFFQDGCALYSIEILVEDAEVLLDGYKD